MLGIAVVGTFHSHIFAAPVPGEGDIDGSFDGQLMFIFDTEAQKFALWLIARRRAKKLRLKLIDGRRRFGKNDEHLVRVDNR
jgi:hypothetical protein